MGNDCESSHEIDNKIQENVQNLKEVNIIQNILRESLMIIYFKIRY